VKTFMSEDFLLSTPTARRLYHEVAEGLPIIDYHCLPPPADIANNIKFRSIATCF
jgi:glucuronate isomerase